MAPAVKTEIAFYLSGQVGVLVLIVLMGIVIIGLMRVQQYIQRRTETGM